MKKLLLIVCALIITASTVRAQEKGDFSLGLNTVLGTAIPTMGVGLSAQYHVADQVRIAGNFDYFVINDGVSSFDINVAGHYLIPISGAFTAYPLMGLGVSIYNEGGFAPFVADMGAGCQFNVSPKFRINFEVKTRIGHGVAQAIVGPSFHYIF